MTRDKDIGSQLEGLFADADLESELAPEESDLPTERVLPEQKIIDILGSGTEAEPVVAEPTATEPPMLETAPFVPTFAPTLLEEAPGGGEIEDEWQAPQPAPAGFLVWEAQLRGQRVRIMDRMLGILAGIGTLIIIFLLINLFKEPGRWLQAYIPYFAAYVALVALAIARQLDPRTRATILIALTYSVGVAVLLMEGPLSGGGLYLIAAPVMSAMLVRQRVGAVAAVVSSSLYAGFLLADHLGWLHPAIPYRSDILPSVLSLIATFILVSACIMFVQWMSHQALTSALREARQRHNESTHSRTLLEERANELGKANALLQKRTLQLQTAAQVSATTLSVLDPDALVQQAVNLIQKRLNLYYVGLFLTDSDNAADADPETDKLWARLQAGTGEAGCQMLAMGYQVQVNTSTPMGWCIVNAQPRITLDVGAIHVASTSEHVRAARLLPDTRSEMVLPLRSRGRVIGALVLRSTERGAFSQEDIPVLQTMADQIAVTIDNAQLYAETQANLREVEEVQRRYVREQWAEFIAAREVPAYERTQPDVSTLGDAVPSEVEQAIAQREIVVKSNAGDPTEQATLVVPIMLRDEAIGVLGLQEARGGRQWTKDEIALIEAIADQMALAIENARLLADTQQRAERERVIANITARVRASMDPETILKTAVRELGAALGTDRAFVQLGAGRQTNSKSQISNPQSPNLKS